MSIRPTLTAAFAAIATSAALAAPFTPGNLIVVQMNPDGAASAPGAAGTPVVLKEITPAGVVVQTIAFPSTGTGPKLVVRGQSTATGLSTLNAGKLLVAGFNAVEGAVGSVAVGGFGTSTAVSNSSGAFYARTVGVVSMDGTIDLSTQLTDANAQGDIRMAATSDGTRIWTAGNTGGSAAILATGGVRFTTLGATTSLRLNSTGTGSLTNTRTVNVFDGQLYYGSASGAFIGVNQVGVGLPETALQPVTLLPGTAGTSTSPYDFHFLNPSGGVPTLYVADDGLTATATGGLLKYVLVAGNWVFQYRLSAGLTGANGIFGLTFAGYESGSPVFFATTGEGVTGTGDAATALQRSVVRVVDTGAASTFSVVTTSPVNTTFRGIDAVPYPISGNVTLLGLADPAWRAGRTVSFVLVDAGNRRTPFTAVLDASGGFTGFANVAPGTYTLYGQTLNWLRRSATVTVTSTGATGADLTLDNGDANQDNLTDGLDLAGVDASFNLVEGDTGFNPLADFNKDGIVDGLDLAILDANFNNSGDELP